MKKSISIIGVIVLLFFALFILTGCGNNGSYDKNGKYAKYIEAIRDGQLGLGYGDRTLGELLDNSLKNSKWVYYNNYVPNGNEIPILITGENKNTGDKIEIIYTVQEDSLKYEFQKIMINGEEGSWSDMMNLYVDSANELENNTSN